MLISFNHVVQSFIQQAIVQICYCSRSPQKSHLKFQPNLPYSNDAKTVKGSNNPLRDHTSEEF